MNVRSVLQKLRLCMLPGRKIERDFVNELFSHMNEPILLGEYTEHKNIHLQFRILEIREILQFLASLPFGTENIQKKLNQHLSLCLKYHSTESDTPVQQSLNPLHFRILNLPSICPDYFGFALAKINEIITHLTENEKQNFACVLPQLLPPPLLFLDQSPPYCIENVGKLKEKVQQLCTLCEGSPSTILSSLLRHLRSIRSCYEDVIQLVEENPSYTIKVKAQLSGVGLGFFEIDREVALLLLSRGPTGDIKRVNQHGTHAVCQCEGVFYKPNPKGRAYISPENEFAVYALYSLLHIDGIAPVALIKIQNVIFNAQEGKDNIRYERATQASFGVDGILLQDVIAMAEIPDFLRNCLGKQNADRLFDLFLNQPPEREEIIANYRHIIESFDELEKMGITAKAEVLVSLFEEELGKLSPHERCYEFTELPSDNKTLRDFCSNIDSSKTCQYLLEALWVVKQHPEICVYKKGESRRQIHFHELTDLCKYFRKIKKLFPQLDTKDTMQELDSMLSKFDSENFSAHFLVTMLTNPYDHKSDNLMITFDQAESGKIRKAFIVGIDNDLAFDNESCTKTFIYLLQNMNHSFHYSVIQRLIELTPERLVLDWLIALEEQNKLFRRYIAQKVLTESDFNEDGDAILNIPLELNSSIVPNIYQKLKKLMNILENSTDLSHWDILSHVQSGVFQGYKKAFDTSEQLQECFRAIPAAFDGYKAKECLSNTKESPAIAALTFIKSISLSSFDDLMQAHLIGKMLRFFPGHSGSILIPGEASNVRSRRRFFLIAVEQGYCALVARLLEEEKLIALQENKESTGNQFSLLEQTDQEEKTPFLIASAHANIEMMKLLLFYKCNTLASDVYGKSCVILLLSYLPRNPMDASAAIRLLGEYGDIPWNAGWGSNMINPLHVLVDLYSHIPDIVRPFFSFFMEKGASPDLVDRGGNSPLDYAMQENFVDVVRILIEHGAGRTLNIRLAEEFFQRNPVDDLYSQLIHYSLLLRWKLALRCLQTHTASSGISIEGTQLSKMFLSSDLVGKLFHKGKIRSSCQYGRRSVHRIEIEDKKGTRFELYFKQHPELPGIEYAVDMLFELLIGHGTSYTDLAKVSIRPGKSYSVLISQGIRGENLHEVLKNKPHLLKRLHEQYFSELLLASLLVNFEDAKPDNFILEELPDGKFRIVGIDNDHAFIPPVSKKVDKTILVVKCILYCMDNMSAPIHPKAREKFLSLDPERILQLWLELLVEKHDEYLKLFPRSVGKKLLGVRRKKPLDSTFVSIPFKEGSIVGIYQKFMRIQNCLRGSCDITGMQILRAVIPELGIRYEQAFHDHSSPLQRFYSLVHTHYTIAMNGRCETRVNSRQLLKSMQLNIQDFDGEAIGPRAAIEELERLKNEINAANNTRKRIQQELGKGDVSAFKNLQLDTEKEKIINGVPNEFPPFNFSLLDECLRTNEVAKKVNILETVLCGGNYRTLHIHRCSFVLLGVMFQRKIIESSPQLVSLELYKCTGVDAKMIQSLSGLLCLTSLQLSELYDFQGELAIPIRLRSLEISHCQGIVRLKIPNTLKKLVLRHCRNLNAITVHTLLDNKKLKEEDKTYRIGNVIMIACIKHPLWDIFTRYLQADHSHFLSFAQLCFSTLTGDHLFDVVWADLKRYPKAIMAQDLCRSFKIPFHDFFRKVYARYKVEYDSMNNEWQCVLDCAAAFEEVMKVSNSPQLRLMNHQLTGEIPSVLSELTNLTSVYLNNNYFTGEIPQEIFHLSNLTKLNLSNNQLVGDIPGDISRLSNLVQLNLSHNQLVGKIPDEVSQLSKLTKLLLNNNQFTGEIPCELFQLLQLKELRLSNNQLEGPIHPEVSLLSNLKKLYLNNNQFTAEIPRELLQLSLVELNFNHNHFTGEIPGELLQLSNLTASKEQLTLTPSELKMIEKACKLLSVANAESKKLFTLIIEVQWEHIDAQDAVKVPSKEHYFPSLEVMHEEFFTLLQNCSIILKRNNVMEAMNYILLLSWFSSMMCDHIKSTAQKPISDKTRNQLVNSILATKESTQYRLDYCRSRAADTTVLQSLANNVNTISRALSIIEVNKAPREQLTQPRILEFEASILGSLDCILRILALCREYIVINISLLVCEASCGMNQLCTLINETANNSNIILTQVCESMNQFAFQVDSLRKKFIDLVTAHVTTQQKSEVSVLLLCEKEIRDLFRKILAFIYALYDDASCISKQSMVSPSIKQFNKVDKLLGEIDNYDIDITEILPDVIDIPDDYVPPFPNIWDEPEDDEGRWIVDSQTNQIHAGTLNKLIIAATQNHSEMIPVITCTYSMFTTLEFLLEKIIQRFYAPEEANDSPQIHCISFIKQLLHTVDSNLKSLCGQLLAPLIKNLETMDKYKNTAVHLQRLLQHNPEESQVRIMKCVSICPRKSILFVDELEFAKQVTLVDFELYRTITTLELVEFYRHQDHCRNVISFIKRFNRLAGFFSSAVLWQDSVEERVIALEKALNIAEHLLTLQNFSAVIAIVAAIHSFPISRLLDTKLAQSDTRDLRLQKFDAFAKPTKNYLAYRQALQNAEPPCIPYLGVHLKDTIFAEEANSTYEGGLVNYFKLDQVYKTVNQFLRFKEYPYDFEVSGTYFCISLPMNLESDLKELSLPTEHNETVPEKSFGRWTRIKGRFFGNW